MYITPMYSIIFTFPSQQNILIIPLKEMLITLFEKKAKGLYIKNLYQYIKLLPITNIIDACLRSINYYF